MCVKCASPSDERFLPKSSKNGGKSEANGMVRGMELEMKRRGCCCIHTYVHVVPRELTGQIKGWERRTPEAGKGEVEESERIPRADTEADAANDSVRGNLRVLSVLATWGPPTSNHEPAHASTSFPADQPPLPSRARLLLRFEPLRSEKHRRW